MNSKPIIRPRNLPNSSAAISENVSTALIVSANLAIAAQMARRQQYSQAEQMIFPLVNMEQPCFEALNLLAKIYAQQGKFQNAMDVWRRAQSLEPENRQTQLALNQCENAVANSKVNKGWNNLRRIFVALNIIFVIATIICITIAISMK